MYDTLTSRLGAPMHAKTPAWARSGTLQALLKVRLPYEKYATKVRLPAEAKATTPGAIKNFGDRCGATSQLSAERHRRWMTVTFFDGAGLRPSDQVSMSLLNVAGRELSFAVAVSFSGCCLSRSSSMSLSDVAAA